MHESSDWLIVQLKGIIGALEQMVKNPKSLNSSLSLNETNRLTKLVDELEKWRGDTLLLLYLETRVHCFYHLMSFIKQENNTSYAGKSKLNGRVIAKLAQITKFMLNRSKFIIAKVTIRI